MGKNLRKEKKIDDYTIEFDREKNKFIQKPVRHCNPQQKAFVQNLLDGCLKSEAAVKAGYSEKTAAQAASRLLKMDVVAEYYIKEKERRLTEILEKNAKCLVTEEEIKVFYAREMRNSTNNLNARIKCAENLKTMLDEQKISAENEINIEIKAEIDYLEKQADDIIKKSID